MSVVTKQEEMPVVYRVTKVLRCDGCGEEEVGLVEGALLVGWLRQRRIVENKSATTLEETDYGPKCAEKMLKVIENEKRSIRAEAQAAVAEVRGV